VVVQSGDEQVLREEAVRTLSCGGRRWCRQWVLLDIWRNNRLSAVSISSSISRDYETDRVWQLYILYSVWFSFTPMYRRFDSFNFWCCKLLFWTV